MRALKKTRILAIDLEKWLQTDCFIHTTTELTFQLVWLARRSDTVVEMLLELVDNAKKPPPTKFASSIKYSQSFGSIVWAKTSPKLGFWPACIYDPRLTLEGGGARSLAVKALREDVERVRAAGEEGEGIEKSYLCWLFGFDASKGSFVLTAAGNVVSWEEGKRLGFDRGEIQMEGGQEGGQEGGHEHEHDAKRQRTEEEVDIPELGTKRHKDFSRGVNQAMVEIEKEKLERDE